MFHTIRDRQLYLNEIHTFRTGMRMFIGTHDSIECERSTGCYLVTITHAWTHKGYLDGDLPNDIAVAKQVICPYFL